MKLQKKLESLGLFCQITVAVFYLFIKNFSIDVLVFIGFCQQQIFTC